MYIALVDIEPRLPSLTSQHLMPRHDLLSVGTAAELAGHIVEVYVEVLNGLPSPQTEYDLVGASVTSSNLRRTREFFDKLRLQNPGVTLVAGGPHSTISPIEVVEWCDVVVRDEGEETLVELLEVLESGGSLGAINGISYERHGHIVHRPRRGFVSRPSHASNVKLLQNFTRQNIFAQLVRHGGRYTGYTSTSRGCPFTCNFCYENRIGGTGYRVASTRSMLEDIRTKRDFFGVKHFWLTDSTFGVNPKHAEEVLRALIAADLGCQFSALCRVEVGRRPHLLQLMKEAGFVTVSVGMEAITNKRLADLSKRQRVSDIITAVDAIRSFGMSVFGLFMVGFDDDTEDTPAAIAEFCQRNAVDGLSLYCLTEYIGLPGQTLPRHRICEVNLDYHNGHFVTTFPKRVKPSVLERAVYEALQKFYGLPRVAGSLLRRSINGAAFQLALFRQFRKLARISEGHQAELQDIEEPYYLNGELSDDLLERNPIVKETLRYPLPGCNTFTEIGLEDGVPILAKI